MKGNLGYKIRTITCEGCGKVETKHMPAGRRFCSQPCASKAPKPSRKQGKVVTCEFCGVSFYLPRCRIEMAQHYFCGLPHQIAWQGRHKDAYICKICGITFYWSPSRALAYNVTYCSPECRDADPDRRTMLIEMNAAQQRGKRTGPERIGYQILDAIGIEYLQQYVIGGKFCVDAFIPSVGIVIQFDGDYWHGNPNKFQILNRRQQKRIRLDRSQDAYMRACGYTVERIWESDLRKQVKHVKSRLQQLLIPA